MSDKQPFDHQMGYPLAEAIIASGLPPEKLLYEYPETMTRALLNAALKRDRQPPLWLQAICAQLAKWDTHHKISGPGLID